MTVRLAKIVLLACYGLLMALIAFGNVTDYGSNLPFVRHVLAMDTTFGSPGAIDDPTIQTIAYLAIIATETAAAVVIWWGIVRLLRARRAPAAVFRQAKNVAIAGVTLSLAIWLGGFLAIGGEWFAMWQSDTWNGAESAGRFLLAGGIVLLFLNQPDPDL
jgi:predicted small integral membrane protein